MSIFPVHTPETAPEGAKPILDKVQQRFGFLPNLYGALAESPATLEAYTALQGVLAKTDFSPAEQQIIMLAVSRVNECHYCMAAHSTSAAKQKVPDDVIQALRDGTPIADAKLEALRRFTQTLVEKRGWVSDDEVQAFLAAGYSRPQVLEVIVGIALKTISNYSNHIVNTPLDDVFQARAFQGR